MIRANDLSQLNLFLNEESYSRPVSSPKPITQAQAEFLVSRMGYSFEEVRNLTCQQAHGLIKSFCNK